MDAPSHVEGTGLDWDNRVGMRGGITKFPTLSVSTRSGNPSGHGDPFQVYPVDVHMSL